jgi:hypothetical protein
LVVTIQAVAAREKIGATLSIPMAVIFGLQYGGDTGARMGSVMTMVQRRWQQEHGLLQICECE